MSGDRYAKTWQEALLHVRHLAVSSGGDMDVFMAALDEAITASKRQYGGSHIYQREDAKR